MTRGLPGIFWRTESLLPLSRSSFPPLSCPFSGSVSGFFGFGGGFFGSACDNFSFRNIFHIFRQFAAIGQFFHFFFIFAQDKGLLYISHHAAGQPVQAQRRSEVDREEENHHWQQEAGAASDSRIDFSLVGLFTFAGSPQNLPQTALVFALRHELLSLV